jgi:cytochrome c biogenesis protein CcmG/thiol:disulfide interchange protein DsbE
MIDDPSAGAPSPMDAGAERTDSAGPVDGAQEQADGPAASASAARPTPAMSWRRSLIGLAIALPMVVLFSYGLSRDPSVILSPLPGRPAPGLTLTVMGTDSIIDLESLRGHVVVVNFWASWCGPCRIEHPQLQEARRRWEHRGVKFLGVLYDDSENNARRWLEGWGGEEWPTLLDPRQRSAIDYGVYGVPETFIIDQNGIVAHKQLSVVYADAIAPIIEELLSRAGEDP